MAGGYPELRNELVRAANGVDYAHRDTGGSEGGLPLVLLQHFRSNLDNWDPALIDALATARRVVAFDNAGVAPARSSGVRDELTTPAGWGGVRSTCREGENARAVSLSAMNGSAIPMARTSGMTTGTTMNTRVDPPMIWLSFLPLITVIGGRLST